MSESSSQQQLEWCKDKYQYYPITGSYMSHPSPLLSDQDQEEEDQIKSWLCFPSDSNQDNNAMLFGADLNNKQIVEGSNDNMCVMKAHDVDAAIVPSNSMAKGNEDASTFKKVGTSQAAKVIKMTKEKQEVKSGHQVVESGSVLKKKDIADPPGVLPKRLRPPEVHRQSERMRRGKINEKIKALQQLIPRCSKLDKASTLDKAIGYMKDLQLQVRMMSGGYDMGMQMFPVIPQAPMSSMFSDMNVPALPAIPANMDPGRMCLGPSMMPYAPTPPYPAPPVHMPYQHNMASNSLFQCPQGGNTRALFLMQGRYQM